MGTKSHAQCIYRRGDCGIEGLKGFHYILKLNVGPSRSIFMLMPLNC
mgnify:FL=1